MGVHAGIRARNEAAVAILRRAALTERDRVEKELNETRERFHSIRPEYRNVKMAQYGHMTVAECLRAAEQEKVHADHAVKMLEGMITRMNKRT